MKTTSTQHAVHKTVIEALAGATGLAPAEVVGQLGRPPKPEMGDYAFPCFAFAKAHKQPPPAAAAQLAEKLKADASLAPIVEKIDAAGPFLNIRVKPGALVGSVLRSVFADEGKFGCTDAGQGKTIVIDYSSPNIAKPFHVGHLMTTILGASLVRIFRALGYKVVGVNHLGDWGVQCGFQFMAWQRADPAEREKQLAQRGLDYLCELYIDINDAAKADPAIDAQARVLFKKLEDGAPELRALWQRFRAVTLNYLQQSYDRLGIKFESTDGEAFYEPRLKPLLAELKEKGVAVESEGALVIPMEDGPPKPDKPSKPPFILLKSDEATIYGTRDLAAAIYRKKTYDFDKNLYVVDVRQSQYLQSLSKALAKIGYAWAKDCAHVSFGLMQIREGEDVKAMSTRGGRMISLKEVLDHMVEKVRVIVKEKNPDLDASRAARVSEAVGVGAIVFWVQARRRASNFVFDWNAATDPTGDTGPYLQYTHARASSILRKSQLSLPLEKGEIQRGSPGSWRTAELSCLIAPEEVAVAKALEQFPQAVAQAAKDYEPSLVSSYLLDLASAFSNFLNKHRVIDSPTPLREARLALVDAVREVMASGLGLLGVTAPQEM
jgi:arginyl-tRNA synthetase